MTSSHKSGVRLFRGGDVWCRDFRFKISESLPLPESTIPLGAPFEPTFQPASIFLQQEATGSETLAQNTVRLRIACRPRDPLFAHLLLAAREPFLRQNLNQSRLQIDDIKCEGWLVGTLGGVTGGDDYFVDSSQFAGHVNFMHAGRERK